MSQLSTFGECDYNDGLEVLNSVVTLWQKEVSVQIACTCVIVFAIDLDTMCLESDNDVMEPTHA